MIKEIVNMLFKNEGTKQPVGFFKKIGSQKKKADEIISSISFLN